MIRRESVSPTNASVTADPAVRRFATHLDSWLQREAAARNTSLLSTVSYFSIEDAANASAPGVPAGAGELLSSFFEPLAEKFVAVRDFLLLC